ncbi:hypothetical protein [Amycolatopsis sp. SID8362]|uniref:hypothetical protein n=1 Tax=Amycolatopsis sp. SID8362 TaxID=2690346 RepID=UPI001EF3AAEB|nr:hypothetical protein [Amycolatopsis sp. SID8362]
MVRAEFLDEVAGVRTLSVQSVGGHHNPSRVHCGRQRLETGDFVVLSVYFSLTHNDSVVVGHRRREVHTAFGRVIAGVAEVFAVHRDRPSIIVLVGRPGTDRAIERVSTDQSRHSPQGGLTGSTIDAALPVDACFGRGQEMLRQVSGPFADRSERARLRRRGGRSDQRGRRNRVPCLASVPRIGHRGEVFTQVSDLAQCMRRALKQTRCVGRLVQCGGNQG